MYRAYVYYSNGGLPENGVRLTSGGVETQEEACKLLERLLDLPGMTGGDVEVKVSKMWVRADEAETHAWLTEREV